MKRPLPAVFTIGDAFVADLAPHRLTPTQFDVESDLNVVFNVTLPITGRLVVYGRRTAVPTPAEHDFVQIVIGRQLHHVVAEESARTKRETRVGVSKMKLSMIHRLCQTWSLRPSCNIAQPAGGTWRC